MPSHDSFWRGVFERALRVSSLVLLGWMIWASLAHQDQMRGAIVSGSVDLPGTLKRWSIEPGGDSLHVALDTVPGQSVKAWLVALRRTGSSVSWSAADVPATALEVFAIGGPSHGIRALAAAPEGTTVLFSDVLGAIDSVRVAANGASLILPALAAPLEIRVGSHRALALVPDSIKNRTVLVLAKAGWEAKFVIAALEEQGWEVDSRLSVAPGVAVRQGEPSAIDTARLAAVIALDSSAAREAARISAFVRNGGGLVLGPSAARSRAFAAVAAGAVGDRRTAPAAQFVSREPRLSLPLQPVVTLQRDALVLETRGEQVAIAARRVAAGRVVQLGYDDTWRWRLEGGASSPDDHRSWWSGVVQSVAYRAAVPLVLREHPDGAPLAGLVHALGPESQRPAATTRTPAARRLHAWMAVLLLGMLVTEWASRRLRGFA